MLHANLKDVCSPQIASIGEGDTCVHCFVDSSILEELMSVFDNQVLWFECSQSAMCVGLFDIWHKSVLCGTKMSYAFLLIIDGAPSHMSNGKKSLKKKNANNRKTASCHKRGLILHIGSLSQKLLDF